MAKITLKMEASSNLIETVRECSLLEAVKFIFNYLSGDAVNAPKVGEGYISIKFISDADPQEYIVEASGEEYDQLTEALAYWVYLDEEYRLRPGLELKDKQYLLISGEDRPRWVMISALQLFLGKCRTRSYWISMARPLKELHVKALHCMSLEQLQDIAIRRLSQHLTDDQLHAECGEYLLPVQILREPDGLLALLKP